MVAHKSICAKWMGRWNIWKQKAILPLVKSRVDARRAARIAQSVITPFCWDFASEKIDVILKRKTGARKQLVSSLEVSRHQIHEINLDV